MYTLLYVVVNLKGMRGGVSPLDFDWLIRRGQEELGDKPGIQKYQLNEILRSLPK